MKNIHIGARKTVNTAEIKFLKADINYTHIFFIDGTTVLVSTTLGAIESLLPKGSFVRVNRKEVLNCKQVSQYFIRPDYDEIKLKDSSLLRVSRRRKTEIRKLLINEN